jgi:hypothetical protein
MTASAVTLGGLVARLADNHAPSSPTTWAERMTRADDADPRQTHGPP